MARWNRVHQLPYLLFRLQDRIRQLREKGTISDWLDFAYGSPFPPGQIRPEISAFITRVAQREPQTMLEIGAGEGGTLMLLAMAAAPEATIISVDLPHGAFGGGPLWKAIYFRRFGIPSQRMHLLRVNSHAPTTLQRVREILGDRLLDVLFIDGDHTYGGVKADWEMYGPVVARDGLIGFHDIVQHPPETGCEVQVFWEELKARHAHVEIVANREQVWGGIGVIENGRTGSD
jgi:predicted O-methyltransferase YrrM